MSIGTTYRVLARTHLTEAVKLLDGGDDEVLVYACLELRRVIEALCYSLLGAYLPEVSARAYQTWQPKKVMDELLAIDPNVHRSSTIRKGREGLNGEPPTEMRTLGEDRRLEPRNAVKYYNKLGSYFHVPTVRQLQKPPISTGEMREAATEIRGMLEIILSSTVWNFTFSAEFRDLTCSCGFIIRRRFSDLTLGSEIQCGFCTRFYIVAADEGNRIVLIPNRLSWTCDSCGEQREIDKGAAKDALDVSCPKCGDKATLKHVSKWVIERVANL